MRSSLLVWWYMQHFADAAKVEKAEDAFGVDSALTDEAASVIIEVWLLGLSSTRF